MRWPYRKKPAIGSTRIVLQFIWKPKCLPVGDPSALKRWKNLSFANENRWLCFSSVKQIYTELTDGCCYFFQWKDCCWADKDRPLNWR
jgi:hypothetical protein